MEWGGEVKRVAARSLMSEEMGEEENLDGTFVRLNDFRVDFIGIAVVVLEDWLHTAIAAR